MGSSEIEGSNGAFSSNGGLLPQSLLDSASSSTPWDDNLSLIGLQKTFGGSNPITSEFKRLFSSGTIATEDKYYKENQSIITNYTPTVGSVFDFNHSFNTRQISTNIALLPSTNTSENSNSTKEKDALTGNIASTLLFSANALDSLTGKENAKPQSQVQTLSALSTQSSSFAIRTEGTISINNGGDFDGVPTSLSDDALIYAAKGFTINGNPVLPVERDANGNPIRDTSGKLILLDKAVAVAAGYTVTNGPSNQYTGLIPPQVVAQQTVIVPAYVDIKQFELDRRIPFGTDTVTFNISQNPINSINDWTNKFPPTGTLSNPKVVRVIGGGLNVPANVSLSNYIITVDQGDINFNGNGQNFNNVVLIANNGNINLSNVQSRDLSVFASSSINMNAGARFAGYTTIANGSSSGNITFNGATTTTNTTDNLKVISTGDITYNGAADTRGSLLSVKNFIFNNSSTLYGEIGAKGNIIFNGSATVISATISSPDTTPPVITANLANDTARGGATNTDKITFDPTITGSVTDASNIVEFKAGFNNTLTANYTNVLAQRNANGTFNFNRTQLSTIYGSTLPDGTHTLHLVAKDQYNNQSNVFDLTFTLDSVTLAPSNLDLPASNDSGLSNTDNITNKTTPTITGNAEVGALVQLFNNGQLLGQATADSTGTWLITTNNLTNQTYNLTATATDIAGNVSLLSTPLNLVIDTIAPVTPNNLKLTNASDTGASNSDNITKNTTPSIQGNAEALSTVRLFRDGQLVRQTIATAAGSWQLSVGTLTDGVYHFTATATDVAGNVSLPSSQLPVTIDTQIAAPTLDLLAASDSGQSNSDDITNDTTSTIAGNADTGSTVQLFNNGQLVGQTTVANDSTWQITTNALTDGTYNLTATATDVAGNVSIPSAPLRVTIDSALPQVTLTTPVDTQPLIPGARLTGSVDGTGSTVTALSYRFDTRAEIAVPFNATGAFDQSLELTELSNGAHTLTISTTDKAGNVKTAQYNIFVNIDINAPTIAAVLVNDTALGNITNTDRITSDPTIAGNVIDASRVIEFRAGFDTTTTANFVSILPQRQADGSFRFDRTQLESIYGSTTLPDGTHTLHLQAVDEYSNTSNVFDFTFTLDTTPPVEPVLRLNPISDSTSNNLQTTQATVTLIGQTEANATIVLQETNSTITADASGNFQFIGVHLNLGANDFSLRVIDVAGNTSVFTETITRDRQNDVVLDWNATLLNAIKIDSTAPPLASRNMAMVHTAIYDAVNAIARNYSVYYVDAQAPAETSSAAAAAEAAYGVLINLYPNQKTTFDTALLASLAAIPDGTAENNGIALGQQVAQQIFDWRSTDGYKTVLAFAPGSKPGDWQPTPAAYNGALLPQWTAVTPFAMTNGSQFRPDGPPALNSAEYTADFNQVKELGNNNSTTRTTEQTQIANFWADGSGTYTPPGHWNQIAEAAAQERGNTLEENARLFALLNIGLADAGIAAWDAKYTYNFWRPITAIRNADTDGNAATTADPNWTPLITTPPFPEYVSGHSTFSGTADAILTNFFGSNFSFSSTSVGLAGVTRSFNSFTDAANEAGISRIYGGIHFNSANIDGLATGRALGDYVYQNYLTSNVRDPLIQAGLANDTAPNGSTNRDRITSDPMIAGSITVPNNTIRLRVGFGNTPASSFTDVTNSLSADGHFSLNRSQLATIYGSSLADGTYTLHLELVDLLGNRLGGDDVSFTIDTAAPTISLDTPNAVGNYSNTARLIGNTTDKGSRVVSGRYNVDGQAFSPISVNNQGQFSQEIATSGLAAGFHHVVMEVFDTAGNSTQTSADFTVSNDFFIGGAGTQGWGNKTANSVILGEQNSFVTQTAIPIALGQTQGKRQLEFDLNTLFDTTDTTAVSKDRLAVYLVDPTNPNVTLLDRGEPGTALFSLDETGSEFTPGLVNYNGSRVQVDLTSLANKTTGSLVFQLINNDGDTDSVVQVQNLTNIVDPEGVNSPIFPTGTDRATVGLTLNLGNFTTALNTKLLVSNVHLDTATGRYTADLQAHNIGITTLSRQLVVVLTNLPTGVSLLNPSGVHPAGSPYINLTNAIRPGGLAAGAISDVVQVVFDNPSLLHFDLQAVFLAGAPEQSPLLQNPGSLNVKPGERLAIPLVASDPNGDPITFSLRSAQPLPKGKLNSDGTLVFTPSPEQVGTYNFTVVASSGGVEATQDVILTVTADPVTTTRIFGVIQNTNQAPLTGVVIELGGTQTTTAADGSFLLEFPGALPSNTLKVHGEQIPGTDVYPFIAEKLPLLLEHEVYANVNNVIARPIYLPPIDTANAHTIDPNVNETVTSTTIPGSAVFVAAGTLKNQQGNPFTGQLSITEVPTSLTPAALPENLHPDLVVTIQPGEMVFTTPAPLTLPNRAGYAPLTEMDLWSINPTTGLFNNVGTGKVSADGSVIETISGGIRNSSWHFFAPPPGVFGTLKDVNKDPRNLDDKCNKCEATESINSEVELHSGAVQETHDLITYQSLGETRGLTLKYNSQRADPRPIVHFGYDNVQSINTTGLLVAKLAVKRGDFTYQVPGIAQGQYGFSGGEHFWSLPNAGTADAALQADLRSLPSGQYTYELTTGLLTSSFNGSATTSTGKLINVNTINSSFGSGWGLAGLQEVVENEDGSALLIDGDGSQLLFEAPTAPNSSYASPAGDMSTLVRLADGTFRRTMKDQTIYHFNTQNKLELMRDRNGNETQYIYNTAAQLTQMIDPVGLATTFTYTGGKVTGITDPAGRTTQMEYDSKGNLIKITDPDNSAKSWEYDNEHHVTAAVDKMGNRGEDFYDFAGRVTRGVRPDGSVVQVNPVEVQGLYRPEQTLNPFSAPVAKDLGAAEASYADGNGNVVRTLLDRAGQAVSSTDGASFMPTVERNADNMVTKSTDARGYVTNYTYDAKGNVLTIKDELSQSSPGSGTSANLFPNPIYKTGNNPQQIVTADLNQDGFLDLVSANFYSSSVSVLFGEEQGTFSAPTNVAIGSNPKSIALGDVNGDGKVDLVTTNFSSNDVFVLLGDGQGTFSAPTPANLALETSPDSIALGDLDADGDLDLIVSIVDYTIGYGSDNVSVLLNNGNGTFGIKTNNAIENEAQSIAVGDVNGDGKVDLVTSNFSRNNASVLYGDGQGRFSVPTNLALGDSPNSIALGDLDADGDLDFAFSAQGYGSDTLSILLNNGNGTFGTKTNYALNNGVQSIAVAEVNKDGKLDLMIANSYSDNVSVLLNNGDGTFITKTDYTSGNSPNSVALGDVNGDGTVDVLNSNLYGNTVSVRLGNGDGTFSPVVNNYTVGNSFTEFLALGDVNFDGNLDLVTANTGNGYGSDVSVLLGNGDGTFRARTDYLVGSFPNSVALGDVNFDGRLDLVTANYYDNSVSVLLGNGDGTFAAKVDYLVGSVPSSVALGDVNFDGRLDLVVANNSGVSILLGNGDGTFAAKVDYAAGTEPSFVVLKDLNSDGRLDLVTANYDGVSVLLNNNGTFTTKTDYEVRTNLKSVAVGDANSDGYFDLLTTNFDDDSVSVLLGNGTGVFDAEKRLEFAVGDGPSSIALSDLDADGDLDFVTANYNGNNVSVRLNSTIQPGVSSGIGERRYTYDPIFNQATSSTDELGRKTLYEIDPLTGNLLSTTRVVGTVGGDDDVVAQYSYTAKGQIDIITDALGRVTDYDYNAFGELIKTTFAKGTVDEASQQFEYDAAGNQTAVIDEKGDRTEFVYDRMNQLLKTIETDPDGIGLLTSPITTYIYNVNGNQKSVTDARNSLTTNDYDRMERLIKTTDAQGGVMRYVYDKSGNLVSIIDQLGRETKSRYDGRDRLIETIRPDGTSEKPRYDFDNNQTSVIDANGNRTNNVYDARGRLIRELDPLGNVTRYEYDAANQLVATIDANGHKTQYRYDDLGRQVEVIDALGHVTKTEYNKVGNVIADTNALEHTTRYTYDNRDRQKVVIDALNYTTTTVYDAVGNTTAIADQLGRTTQYSYDAQNRQTSITDPLNHTTTYTYDAVNNLASITDALARTTQYGYDALNRRTSITNALGDTATTIYDAVGNITAVTDELGRTTKFTYDRRDRRTASIDPLSHKTTTEYDANGNLTAVTDALGQTTRSGYDALDRQITVTDARNQTTTTTYDAVGKVFTITDPVNNSTTYTYDALNRLQASKNQLGKIRSYEYDAVGNQIAATDRNQRKQTFTYDALDRLNSEKWLNASGNAIRTIGYTYDAASQLATASDPDSSYSYTYDAAGRIIAVDNAGTSGVPNIVLNYTYDLVGNRLNVTDTINGTLRGTETFNYDNLNRVTRITENGNGVTNKRVDIAYDKASQLKSIIRYADLSGTQLVADSIYTYDLAGRLIDLTHKQGATNLAAYTFDYDVANRITKFTSVDGISDYSYDSTNQLTATDHSFQTDEAYSYDANGNRTNTGYQNGTDNRLLSDGKYNYEYDFEGNRTKRTEIASGKVTEYTWDYHNRLTKVVDKNVSGNITLQADYTYDVFDRRLAKVVDADGAGIATATVERFVYDDDNIALTFDGNGIITNRYLHGPVVDQILASENATGQVLWTLADNQGTVRDVVDSTGILQNHITYNSFGNVTSQTNPTVSIRFGYTGREFDEETGQYYYRARYYDSQVGEFISEDPIGFAGGDANLYRYVANSPINVIDPTGNFVIPSPTGGIGGFFKTIVGIVGAAAEGISAASVVGATFLAGGIVLLLQEPTADDTRSLARRKPQKTTDTPIPTPRPEPQPLPPNHKPDNPNDCDQKKRDHRGRIQAQGGGTEKSVPWAKKTPPTRIEGLNYLTILKSQLTKKELKLREQLFPKAEKWINGAADTGGVDAYVQQNFRRKDDPEIRIDIEVNKGTAFIP